MARNNAVAAISGELFDREWSRIRGGIPRARQKHMARAAMGHAPAIFKAIRDGGTHTRAQLRNQLGYLTTKSSFIIDSRGTYDGQATLNDKQIDQLTKRFAAQWNAGFHPKLGHTTHLLMAFPIGTKGEHVADIAREVCERFFQGEGAQFDYIAAVHEDRDHPHAHVVLNRRSKDGEFFFLKQDHHFNYDAFREAIVEAAERHGLRLEATRRIDRGVVTKASCLIRHHAIKCRDSKGRSRPCRSSWERYGLQALNMAKSIRRNPLAMRNGFKSRIDDPGAQNSPLHSALKELKGKPQSSALRILEREPSR